jgi:hypothetical protein
MLMQREQRQQPVSWVREVQSGERFDPSDAVPHSVRMEVHPPGGGGGVPISL